MCKDAFTWTTAATEAFYLLKLPDFFADFILETDASNVGIGAILMQVGHPISYFNKKLCPKMHVVFTNIKELHAILFVHKWRQYLIGRLCNAH